MMLKNSSLFILCLCLLTIANIAISAQPKSAQIPEQNNTIRFTVISDLTGGERPGIFDIAVEGISALQPDFVISVGDLIEGGTTDVAQLNKEWLRFSSKVKQVNVPFYPVVGNHDISNLVQRQWWIETIAPRYYHFRYQDMLFLVLDSEDFPDERFDEMARIRLEGIAVYKKNPADFPKTEYANLFERKYGQIRSAQSAYFTKVLADNNDVKWTFIFMHKPLWKRAEKTGFSLLESALSDRKYTVFNGHTHTYHYTKRLGQDYIQLGTTGGAYAPADDGDYMDHIMMVAMGESSDKPTYVNITLSGMRNKRGGMLANGERICSGKQTCSDVR